MTTYIQATPLPPTIVCPAWCAVPAEEHLAELPQWAGMVIHHSDPIAGTVEASSSNFPDGSPDPDEDARIYPEAGARDLSIDEAEELARNILRAVAIVRGSERVGVIPQQRLDSLVEPYINREDNAS